MTKAELLARLEGVPDDAMLVFWDAYAVGVEEPFKPVLHDINPESCTVVLGTKVSLVMLSEAGAGDRMLAQAIAGQLHRDLEGTTGV
jgi:hypothetical protein